MKIHKGVWVVLMILMVLWLTTGNMDIFGLGGLFSFLSFVAFIGLLLLVVFAKVCGKTAEVAGKVADFAINGDAETKARNQKIYDNLPDLGKARVDKNNARLAQVAGLAVPVLAVAVLAPVASGIVTVLAGMQLTRWAFRNWSNQDDNIKAADDKRVKAIRS